MIYKTEEEYRVIEGYENYEVSNFFGNIIMKQKLRKNYRLINLSKDGSMTTLSVHRLVAKAFIQMTKFMLMEINRIIILLIKDGVVKKKI
jgi:hypothetical protein